MDRSARFRVARASAAGAAGVTCGNDPEVCLADPDISSGVFALGAGSHGITMRSTADFAGAAFFRVDAASAVPGPATMLLGFPGLAGILLRARRTP